MSHNINERRMFYYGQEPWHGIGTKLDNPATAKEAIEAAQLDYPVALKKIKTEDGVIIPDKFATVRNDTGTPLGVVGNLYAPVQNVEAFDFFDSIIGEHLAIYHTAGALGRGERIWILAKLPESIRVMKDDVVDKYLLLTNSHDGCSALRMFFTPIRVVCQNTLIAAMSAAKGGISIRHTGNIQSKIKEAQRALGIAINFYGEFERSITKFSDRKLSDAESDMYFVSLICSNNEIDAQDLSTRKQNQLDALNVLYHKPEFTDAQGTLWSAYNAVTRYVDHERTVKNDNMSNRLESIWFGSGAELKSRAFTTAEALLIS